MPQVIALGDINLDIVAHMAYYPPRGGEGITSQCCLRLGGSAANTAFVLACCGMETAIIGRVGTDPLGQQLLADLRAGGVDVSLVQSDPDKTTGVVFVAVTPDGERTMFGSRGANVRLDFQGFPPIQWGRVHHFHLSGYALLEAPQREVALCAMDAACRSGLSVSLDAGVITLMQQNSLIRSLLPRIDLFLPSLDEAELLTGTRDAEMAVIKLREQGVKAIALKLGGKGCMVGVEEGNFSVPPFAVEVRDTTGAGDAFNAGLIAGRLKGLSWRAAALWGNALGALVAHAGINKEVIGREAVAAFLHQSRNQSTWMDWQCEFDTIIQLLKGGGHGGGMARTIG
ncbi:MAG: carbohydrate kinase family protein [Chloroflexi bacterium]|nr:carbohydrate kinase family protein [Chloroflexota bacterium]